MDQGQGRHEDRATGGGPALIPVVYFVRRGENEELRFSLRSLVNLPHSEVFIVGDMPGWVTNVTLIPGNRYPSKWQNVYDNLRIACREVPADRFVVMNDDIFVMRPGPLPSRVRGPLAEHAAKLRRSDWRASLEATDRWLRSEGYPEPLSYEAHIPIDMDRAKLGEALDRAADVSPLPQWRSLYGNLYDVPGVREYDCKIRTVRQRWEPGGQFISTHNDKVFRLHPAGAAIRAAFPDPSPYEVT